MSNVLLNNLESECAELERMIEETPEEWAITRISLQSRLDNVRKELEQVKLLPRRVHGSISFRGAPVFESTGINAAFASDAIKGFEKVIAAKASSLTNPLSSTGRIPDHDKLHLMITGTVAGSFGFELEEFVGDTTQNQFENDELPPLSVETAIENIIDFLKITCDGDDEELADAVADTDRRVVAELRNFLDVLRKWNAICELEFANHSFAFLDSEQPGKSMERLTEDNIKEKEDFISGIFLGILPTKRQFEFQCRADDEIIGGRISCEIEDPTRINHDLDKNVTIKVHVTQVGTSRPKYKLLGYNIEP